MTDHDEQFARIEALLEKIVNHLCLPTSHDNALAIHQARGGSVKTYLQGLNEKAKTKNRREAKR